MKRRRQPVYYWMACTKDEYEFPIYIEDTSIALGKKLGVGSSYINNCIKKGTYAKKYKIAKVLRDDKYK